MSDALGHVQQPPKSRVCGQACLAMILGVTLGQAIKAVGHKNGTKTALLAKVLRESGAECGSRLIPFRSHGIPTGFTGLVKLRWRNGGWHWMVLWGGFVYDPDKSGPVPLGEWRAPSGKRITSGLKVTL